MGSSPPRVDVICLPSTHNCIPVSIFLANPHQSLIGLTDSWTSRQNFSLKQVQSLGLVLLRVGTDPNNPPRPVDYQVPENLLSTELQAQEVVAKEEVSSIVRLSPSEASGLGPGDKEEEGEGHSESETETRERYLDQLTGRLSSGTNMGQLPSTARPPGSRSRMSSSSSSSSSANRGAGILQDQCIQTDLDCCEYRDYYYQPITKAARNAMAEGDKVRLIDDSCSREDQHCLDWGSFREETLVPFQQSLEAMGGFGALTSDNTKGNIFSPQGWSFYKEALNLLPAMTRMGVYSAFHLLMKVVFMILGEVLSA